MAWTERTTSNLTQQVKNINLVQGLHVTEEGHDGHVLTGLKTPASATNMILPART